MEIWFAIQLLLVIWALAMIIVAVVMDSRARRLKDPWARQAAHMRSAAFAVGGLICVVISMFIAAVFS